MAALRLVFCLGLLLGPGNGAGKPVSSDELSTVIDHYVRPYVETKNFSGAIFAQKNGQTVFGKAYGLANREDNVPNSLTTRFHIASMSMQFTAAAVLRLCDQGKLSLDTSVKELIPSTPGAEAITVRHLLNECSGLPDINELPDYSDILQHHQTPETLVARIAGKPLLFPPGGKFMHEEHSAFNLLALLIEKKTGLAFPEAVGQLVFEPLGLKNSLVDDDSPRPGDLARGYEPKGVDDLAPATSIHWSAKAGNASVCTTVEDEACFVTALFGALPQTASLRRALLENKARVGYGWFKKVPSPEENDFAYSMNGRAPGFASFVSYHPHEKLTVVVFSDVYSSSTTTIGYGIANIVLGKPYIAFKPGPALSQADAEKLTGKFQFGPDFYQKNAIVELRAIEQELSLAWPSGESSALIPVGAAAFVDRAYWETVKIERDSEGRAVALDYGNFRGTKMATRFTQMNADSEP